MDDKRTPQEMTVDILLADVLLKINVLVKVLVDKGLIDHNTFNSELENASKHISKLILEKADKSNSLQDFVSKLEETKN